MFTINAISDLPTAEQLWNEIEVVQKRKRERKLLKSDIMSGKFLILCEVALLFCEKYNIQKELIEVLEDGGAVSNSYGHRGQSSMIRFDGSVITVQFAPARSAPHGDNGWRYCRFKIPKIHPAHSVLKEDGWITRSPYIYLFDEKIQLLLPQPKKTDVVLGGITHQAQPAKDAAVLGGGIS